MFEICTLRLGELTVPSADGLIRDPIHAWYATDGKTRILIDSGMPDAAELAARLKVGGRGGGHATLREALASAGTKPEVDRLRFAQSSPFRSRVEPRPVSQRLCVSPARGIVPCGRSRRHAAHLLFQRDAYRSPPPKATRAVAARRWRPRPRERRPLDEDAGPYAGHASRHRHDGERKGGARLRSRRSLSQLASGGPARDAQAHALPRGGLLARLYSQRKRARLCRQHGAGEGGVGHSCASARFPHSGPDAAGLVRDSNSTEGDLSHAAEEAGE